jgi:hypothetical protein
MRRTVPVIPVLAQIPSGHAGLGRLRRIAGGKAVLKRLVEFVVFIAQLRTARLPAAAFMLCPGLNRALAFAIGGGSALAVDIFTRTPFPKVALMCLGPQILFGP